MKKFFQIAIVVVSMLTLFVSNALAVAQLDFTAASTAITAEILPAVTAALPILALLLAIRVGVMVYKRFCKG